MYDKKQIIQIIQNACEELETSERNCVKVPYIVMADYVEVFEELGGWDDCFDTNSGSCDFWIYFFINERKYCLSGSWFYGEYTISRES